MSLVVYPGVEHILELFHRTFREQAGEQFSGFMKRLEAARLEWVLQRARRMEYPPNPGIEEGMPPFYYYFVPGALWGTDKPETVTPLDSGFVTRADGVGLNFGCPLRLHRALKVLEKHEPKWDGSCSAELRAHSKHLPKVEELLWGDSWLSEKIDRETYGNGERRPDWRIQYENGEILLEAKFLPSDWARLTDGANHSPKNCLKRAAGQLPTRSRGETMNAVALTGIAAMDEYLLKVLKNEILAYGNIDVVIYRPFRGDTFLLAKNAEVLRRIERLIRPENYNDSQPFYSVTWVREDARKRHELLQAPGTLEHLNPDIATDILTKEIPCVGSIHRFRAPPFNYRHTLIERTSEGEPIFKVEAPFIMQENPGE